MKLDQLLTEAPIDVNPISIRERIAKSVDYFRTEHPSQQTLDRLMGFLQVRFGAKENVVFGQLNPDTVNMGMHYTASLYGVHAGGYNPVTGETQVYVAPNAPQMVLQHPKKFIDKVTDIITHEQVHKEQHERKMQKSQDSSFTRQPPKNAKQYLQHPYEIGAMAHDVINELETAGYSTEQIISALRTNDIKVLRYSDRYNDFIGQFKNDEAPFKRLKRLITMILQSRAERQSGRQK